ncbi:MAG: HlyD family efflux transporter periplasmic adaptor subunit [Sandaracinaceae bacterium]|nr:HlyD family efflux transporter periplasmic adaptor subunit [Sandaracinaceae bacterium]
MSEPAFAGPYRDPAPPLPSERLVRPPVRARRVALALATAFVTFLIFGVLSPWQQSVRGTGRVIAYAPLERRQSIEAPVSGRVVEWFVQEGSVVAEGDPVVRLSDNDPRQMERLEIEREAGAERLTTGEARVAAQRARLDATARAETSAVSAVEARLRASRQTVSAADQAERAADADLDTAMLNLARLRALREQGLTSERDLELALLGEARARTGRDAARARARGARDDLASQQAELDRARANRDAAIEAARTALQTAEADAAAARAALARIEVEVARQRAQLVVAPRAGTILRLEVMPGGEQVRAGEVLALLVPDTDERAVEIVVDGNDAALIAPGRPVRLQFEGWPAVQFTGWPSVAVGTFGGRVAFVDSHDDGRGNFRVVVTPDPDDEPWPSPRFLRQGARANGWVLLEQVTVAFEQWRQFNGFPPMLDQPPTPERRASRGRSGT